MVEYVINPSERPPQTIPTFPWFTIHGIVSSKNLLVNYDTLDAGKGTPLHTHSSEEAWYVVKGGGFLRVEGVKYEFQEGDFLYVPPHIERQLVNTRDEVMVYIAIVVPPIDADSDLKVIEPFSSKHLQE